MSIIVSTKIVSDRDTKTGTETKTPKHSGTIINVSITTDTKQVIFWSLGISSALKMDESWCRDLSATDSVVTDTFSAF